MNANTVPIQEVIPWSPDIPRNILICDSVETDGSFILSTMVAQLFSSSSSSLPSLSPTTGVSAASSEYSGNGTTTSNQQRRTQNMTPLPIRRQQQQQQRRRALWLSGNASTEQQVASTLKKSGVSNTNKNIDLTIRSLTVEIADNLILATNDGNDDNKNNGNGSNQNEIRHPNEQLFDRERFLKKVYEDIKAWINCKSEENENGRTDTTRHSDHVDADSDEKLLESVDDPSSWIILDDITALASILGEKLVYFFLESILSFILRCQEEENECIIEDETTTALTIRKKSKKRRQRRCCCGLIIRCSNDVDQMLYKITTAGNHNDNGNNDRSGWAGAGGQYFKKAFHDTLLSTTSIPWERVALEESVDAIVDVLPLPSGFSREAHGRLIFSEPPNGRGWRNDSSSTTTSTSSSKIANNNYWNKSIFNYSIKDYGVRAIRLRTG